MPKNVIVIDDEELFRAGLVRLIDSFDDFEVALSLNTSELVGELNSPVMRKDEVSLVIMNPPLPVSNGIRFCEWVTKAFNGIPVMIFSNVFSKHSVMKALESGVSAYYSKGISPYELEDIMDELTSRKNFSDIKLESSVRKVLLSDQPPDVDFTAAEEEVLKLVCEQKSSAEISEDLGISVRTVESRKRAMMLKTQSKNIIGVVMAFLRSGHLHQN